VVKDQRVAGGERLDLGVAERLVADVVDRADIEPAAGDLGDELRFALDRLPAVRIEAPLDDVPVDLDLRILVALAQNPAFALLDIARAPRNVNVVKRDRAGLDVRAHAHLLRRADQHAHVPGSAGGEQAALLSVVAGFVHEPHLSGWDAVGLQQAAELLVGVPVLAGR